MKYKNILWDWNGTLIDDVGVALEAVNIMLERRSLPKINIGQYYSYVDTPIIRFYILRAEYSEQLACKIRNNAFFRSSYRRR